MIPKQRFTDAINFKKPQDYVSFMELEFQLYEEFVGKSLIVGFDYVKLSSLEKDRALCHNAEVILEATEKAGHDVLRDINGYWEVAPGEPALLWLPDEQARLDQIKALKKIGGDKYFILSALATTMCIPDGNHIQDFVVDLYENPETVKEQNEIILKEGIKLQNKMLEAGADGIINCSDIAFNNGPFISPDMLDEFYFPYFYRWVESLRSQGIISIWHTDGNITVLLDRAIESGVNAIQCVDPLGGMDIVEIKKTVEGKLAVIGNIDCSILQMGTEETITAEARRVIEGCKGNGGFVLSGCNAIFKGIPVENYEVLIKARYEYGKE